MSTAKTGMGIAGAFVPDKVVTEGLKINKDSEKRKYTFRDQEGFVAKNRDKDQSKLVDDEGLPLVYS